MITDVITLILAALTGIAVFYLADYFHKADQKRTLACLIATPCPHCAKIYGVDLLTNVARVTYDWTPLPGSTVAGLGLPPSTFLATCPSCAAQTEYRDNCQVFVHPQTGVLDFIRQVKSINPASFTLAEYAASGGKSANTITATQKS